MATQSIQQKGLHDALLAAVQRYLRSFPGDMLTTACSLRESYPYIYLTPANLPVLPRIQGCLTLSSEYSLPLVSMILKASLCLKWQQSYTIEDGFDAHFLRNYGWFGLVSPDGPFVSDDLRVTFGYWGENLRYKEHWHEPEETYFVLSGSAVFHSEGQPSRTYTADDVIHHHSNQRHAIDMLPGPLLVMAVWRGKHLTRKSNL